MKGSPAPALRYSHIFRDTTRRDVILLAERLGGGSGWTCLLAPTAINGVLKRSVG
jgi:hypothetical protein